MAHSASTPRPIKQPSLLFNTFDALCSCTNGLAYEWRLKNSQVKKTGSSEATETKFIYRGVFGEVLQCFTIPCRSGVLTSDHAGCAYSCVPSGHAGGPDDGDCRDDKKQPVMTPALHMGDGAAALHECLQK